MAKCGMKTVWLLILLVLCAVFGTALLSGDILLYLAPRMVPIVWFGFVVLGVLTVYQGYDLFQSLRNDEQDNRFNIGILLFFVPLILVFTVTPNTFTPATLANQNVQTAGLTGSANTEVSQERAGDAEASLQMDADESDTFPACILSDEQAKFNPSADLFSEYLYETVDTLVGRTITVYGYVYTDDSFPEDMILVARQMITCCAADASVVGFHVQVEPDHELQKNEWIRITGTIQSKSMLYYDSYYDFPVITNGLILRCNTPDIQEVYIYP